MNIDRLCQFVLLFFLFSFLGWLMEVSLMYFKHRRFINRGFLRGPFCPIYGCGVVLLTFIDLYLIKKKRKFYETFLLGFIVCGVLEYVVSWLLEKIYHARWWDYTNKKYHLHGRICLENLILFGIASIVVLNYINPIFFQVVSHIPSFLIVSLAFLLILFVSIDLVITHIYTFKIKELINPNIRDHTEEIQRLLKLKH